MPVQPVSDERNFLAPSRLESEAVQEGEITGDESEAPHNQQNSQYDQQPAARYFHGVHVELETVVELQETLDSEGCNQKRHRESR